ncbi:MAG: response regulator transcription factor [Bryobacteraceae bacterium]
MTAEEKKPTAIIADDHATVHALLRRVLEPEFEVVKSVLDGEALCDATLRLGPDLIVVDVVMPVLDGIEAVKRLKARSSTVVVVFVSTDAAEENVQRALKTGALAFVRKASAAEDLLPAARAALQGRRFVSGSPG